MEVHPPGIRDTLVYLQQQYGLLRFLITEKGLATASLDDQPRVDYYRDYMAQVLLAMTEDHVNVFGYTAWSLMDNLEWDDGYTSRFGLHRVNSSSPARTRTARTRTRTARRSAHYYTQAARAHDTDFVDQMTSLHNILIFIINNNN